MVIINLKRRGFRGGLHHLILYFQQILQRMHAAKFVVRMSLGFMMRSCRWADSKASSHYGRMNVDRLTLLLGDFSPRNRGPRPHQSKFHSFSSCPTPYYISYGLLAQYIISEITKMSFFCKDSYHKIASSHGEEGKSSTDPFLAEEGNFHHDDSMSSPSRRFAVIGGIVFITSLLLSFTAGALLSGPTDARCTRLLSTYCKRILALCFS